MGGRYDPRNKLNNLTGKDWLLRTKSFVFSEKSKLDKPAYDHPAPFLVKDVQKFIEMFTKKEMVVFDPFMGSGTTAIASFLSNRKSIGIDLNPEYKTLAQSRFDDLEMIENDDYVYMVGDSLIKIDEVDEFDYLITSPPYHNILQNKSKGLRDDRSSRGYRNGSRQGVEYYSEKDNDLGNQEYYEDFIELFKKIMEKAFKKLKTGAYCSIIISDFTVDKKEVFVQGDVVRAMQEIGYTFVGTIALLQDHKPLFPFGYPYAFKINHMHQNIINFRKE
ncbi:site-specific DNA-methyltransferase [Hujiaoplasma nucleasis]|uniref:Methyltransferase n=1 Tax=Hujiaoplasma nucleasis TaxID=2725268 RepID=A0A7L6N1R4_9MOLU|nr:DNA methyltransferase [Hujiaoplasma nucleasis]QLY40196.1 site-specific DNA-methyltransferase [Hujiaoplasma nucleasis]